MKIWLTEMVAALVLATSSSCAVATNEPQWTVWKAWGKAPQTATWRRRDNRIVYSRRVPLVTKMAVGSIIRYGPPGLKIRAVCNVQNIARGLAE